MNSNLLFDFVVDKENKDITVKREFAAPVKKVWAAWTQADLLDQWWAPKPWKAKTKKMDFKEGGTWLYAMVGPENEIHWSKADYRKIDPEKRFTGVDAFCDENGNTNTAFPTSDWDVTFEPSNGSTVVTIKIKYKALADLEKYIEMGFKEGFTAGLENLDEVLAAN